MLTVREIKALCAAGNIAYEAYTSGGLWICELQSEQVTALGAGDTEREASNDVWERYLRMVSGEYYVDRRGD
jgi:hypothetical protein